MLKVIKDSENQSEVKDLDLLSISSFTCGGLDFNGFKFLLAAHVSCIINLCSF